MTPILHCSLRLVDVLNIGKCPNIDNAGLASWDKCDVILWKGDIVDSMPMAFEGVEGVVVDGIEDEDVGVLVWDDELASVGVADDAASGEVYVVEVAELLVD